MTKYYIDTKKINEREFFDKLEEKVNNYVSDGYDDILDDCYEPVTIGHYEFQASDVLKQCDPVAYRCGLIDYADSLLSDFKYDLERYGEIEVNDVVFTIEE